MSSEVDTLIVGAGFAGLATAWQLSRLEPSERILILEREKRLGGQSSGNNAGMLRQAVADRAIARLAREGRRLFNSLKGPRWRGLRLAPSGSLLLASNGCKEWREIEAAAGAERVDLRILDRDQAACLVPVLQTSVFRRALFCPGDASLDIRGFLKGLTRELRSRGILIHLGISPQGIFKTKRGFLVLAGRGVFRARRIVNTAGAWAGGIARMAGAARIPFRAYRRHLYTSGAFKGAGPSWPFVWDLEKKFYFRPSGSGCSLILSPCDKEFFDIKRRRFGLDNRTDPRLRRVVRKKMERFSPAFRGLKLTAEQAGLRTMAPDGRFVIGEDPRLEGFYWVAGLGGHGVTTSLSAGRMAARLILGKKTDPFLERAFSPRRFHAA
ncbi:MAG: hypothetical protein A3D28_02480 [Omnitrophica bacterium RIFCSPHIGHO2_02_FULL_63_14]|nr:MAG: hypothetical protein A3D28_02480 [Omnitrophica bacterium RIFCSPHIGHO2_02_FULL_63_14]